VHEGKPDSNIKQVNAMRNNELPPAEKEPFFNALYKDYWYKVFRHSYEYTGSKQDAEDMAQEVFLKLWLQLDRLSEALTNAGGYLFIMTKNTCHNHYKKELRKRPLYKDYCRAYTETYTDDAIIVKEIDRIATRAVQKLPAKQKKVFIYRDLGLGRQEIASILQVSVNTVDVCINIAMKKVRQYVSRELELAAAA
jgi:RNA polymerase sigma-70 factor (ECF subfamily)